MNEYRHTICEQTDSNASLRSVEMKDISGMQGEALPYSLRTDWPITCVIFFCFFLIIYAIRNGKKYLYQHFKDFFRQKDRAGLFDVTSGSDFKYTVALSGVCCISCGIFLFDYFTDTQAKLLQNVPHLLLLSIYAASVLALMCVKWIFYNLVNWTFFEKSQRKRWIVSYFDLSGACGLALFSLALVTVYFDLPLKTSLTFVLSVLACSKILLFYKSIRNFFNHFHGVLHLILYFCALEIAPLLFLWKGLGYINNLLILNF